MARHPHKNVTQSLGECLAISVGLEMARHPGLLNWFGHFVTSEQEMQTHVP